MRIAGVICECNPPHAGHTYLLERARADGADLILCVMSGCFVQRGDVAVIDAYARGEILVRAGADAVVELPMPYAASAAEYFGFSGVDILRRLGVTELWFGSETGEVKHLLLLAEIAEREDFAMLYRKRCTEGIGTAQAYFETLSELCGEKITLSPNDILALSYLRAIRRTGAKMQPRAVKRIGSGYREQDLQESSVPSATALRHLWESEGAEALSEHLSDVTLEVIRREIDAGHAPARLENAERLIIGALRLADPNALASFYGLGGGLAGRLVSAAREANSFSALVALAASKAYPDATVRRAILYAVLGVVEEDLRTPASYVRLLAANARGRAHLSRERRHSDLPVLTRLRDLPRHTAARRQHTLEERTLRLYALSEPYAEGEKRLLCHKPVILL